MARAGWAGSPMHRALCIKMFFTWTFLGKQNAKLKFEILVIYLMTILTPQFRATTFLNNRSVFFEATK